MTEEERKKRDKEMAEMVEEYAQMEVPKGIRNLRGRNDTKIQLYHTLKSEIEPMLSDKDVTLDSFIIANTRYNVVSHMGTKEEFYSDHVLFDEDSDYVKRLFGFLR